MMLIQEAFLTFFNGHFSTFMLISKGGVGGV